jgi:hypothetical protein
VTTLPAVSTTVIEPVTFAPTLVATVGNVSLTERIGLTAGGTAAALG